MKRYLSLALILFMTAQSSFAGLVLDDIKAPKENLKETLKGWPNRRKTRNPKSYIRRFEYKKNVT